MKKKFLVFGTKDLNNNPIIPIIVETTSEEEALRIVEEQFVEYKQYKKWDTRELKSVLRIKEKDILIKEIIETTFSKDHFIRIIQIYQSMLLNGKIRLTSLLEIFAPYMVTEDMREFYGQPLMGNIYFQYLPKKFKFYNKGNTNFKIWSEKVKFANNEDRVVLIVKQVGYNKHIKYSFVDTILEFSKIIPDMPARLEQVIIKNL